MIEHMIKGFGGYKEPEKSFWTKIKRVAETKFYWVTLCFLSTILLFQNSCKHLAIRLAITNGSSKFN